jgi:hypothetical protein
MEKRIRVSCLSGKVGVSEDTWGHSQSWLVRDIWGRRNIGDIDEMKKLI